MSARLLMYAAIISVVLCSNAAVAQESSDDPFDGGFSVNYKAEVFSLGAQNDSLHSWGFGWLSGLIKIGESSFPESYLCGNNRDIAKGDFDGDYSDEVVVVWDRGDGGVFVGIPTIDPGTLAPDPSRWNLPDTTGSPGVLYATSGLVDVLGEIRVVAGNFYDDHAEEFVLAYLAADGTVTLTVFDVDVDVDSLIPTAMASISDQAVNTALPELQQFGAVSRFDVATGDFNGDGLDEVALVVNDPTQSPATNLVLSIYNYDSSSHALNLIQSIPYAANSDVNHPCLRNVLIETGNFEPDSLDEIAILDSWSRNDVDSSRVGTLHTLKLTPLMDAIDASQMQALPSCSWQNDAGFFGPNGTVTSMTTYNGKLIVGGQFTLVGGILANNIASWDGARWRRLGEGVNGRVEALEVYEDTLIVGGSFTQAGEVPANYLARWDGSSWAEFGGGANDCVQNLLATVSVSEGSLFACGWFTEVGGTTSASRIARWDGSAWHTVGSGGGLNAPGLDMMEWGDRIVVTGLFTYLQGHYIFHWLPSDPDSWHFFGGGLYGKGVALENIDGTLIVGGDFTSVAGFITPITANRLAYWAGSWWSSYGSPGLNALVDDLLFDDVTNNLYVGGYFTTAGGINASRIARFAVGPNTWDSLGPGVGNAAGDAAVKELCFYGGELIAGGWFDRAGDIITGGLARWDGSNWHALSDSLPPMFSVGLAVGRFDAVSKLDDIAITACASDLGNVRRYLRVYGVDSLSAPLTLLEKGETNISGYWTDSELARSRRLIAIDDITGDGQADLAVLTSEFPNRIEIYEPCDAMNNCTFDPMPQAGSWVSDSANLTQLVLADLDTASITIGPPKYYHVDSIVQPLVILNVPPVHVDYDYAGDSIWDISERYPWPPPALSPYVTYCAYGNRQDWASSVNSIVRKDWGISAGLKAEYSNCGLKIKTHLDTKYGEGFSEQETNETILSLIQIMEAHAEDMILTASIDYDIWEYPVYYGGVRLVGGDVVVVDPSDVRKVWMVGKDIESWISDHEVENILSYATYPDLADNPMVDSGGVIQGVTWLMLPDGSGDFVLRKEEFESTSVDTSRNFGMTVGASLGYKGGLSFFGAGAKFGIELKVDGHYDHSELSTYTTAFTTADSLHVTYGYINSSGSFEGNRMYEITPYAYWAKNGALVLDYAAKPKSNTQGEDPTWWQIHYSDPDPAFILPWRLDPEKDGSLPGENRYKTREIVFIPSYPEPGDTVLIIARVHNFSLVPTPVPVKVSFYLGDPDNCGQLLYDKNTDASTFFGCDADDIPVPIPSQGEVAAQMVWQVPPEGDITECQRIWALIDPLDEISPEVHDNDAMITNNKGWNRLDVNTATKCIDRDGDGWEESAFRCCDQYSHWDNCPDVYNPFQEDSDGDGIGDACEPVVIVCGDANGDDIVNVGDAVFLINYVFKSGLAPDPVCSADVNGDGVVNVGDAVYLINFVFKSGLTPVGDCCG